MIFKSEGSQGDLNGFLDAGSHMQGELHFEDTFRVDGQLTGKIMSKGDLVVGEGGRIEGEVHVGRVYVSGVVKGAIRASRRVEISPRGKVYADIQTSSLVIEDGAYFEGQCAMVRDTAAKTPEPTSKPAPAAAPKLVQPVPLKKA